MPTDSASDSQCDRVKCNRRLGSSEVFKQAILKNASKKQSAQPATTHSFAVFEDLLNHFHQLDANNTNIFETEYGIVETMKNSLSSQYPEVLNGQKHKLTRIPERFKYNKDMSISIQGLEDRITEERSKQGHSQYDEKEIKKMENVVKNIKGDVAENVVYSALERLWNGKRGVLLHSFKPEHLLSQLTQRAKAQRTNSKSLQFTKLEEKLASILNIDTTHEAKQIMNQVQQGNPNVTSLGEKVLISALENQGLEKKKLGVIISTLQRISKTLKKTDYTIVEAEQAVAIGLLHHFLKPDGEMDYLGVLADDKLLVNLEVKFQLSDRKEGAAKLLSNAADQTNHTEEYLARVFAPLFSNGWRLIKVAIIIPGNFEDGSYCESCARFILTSKSLDDIESWWRQTLLEMTAPITGRWLNYMEFLKFFELVVSSISTTSHLSAWTRIVGRKTKLPIAAGYTPVQGSFGTPTKGAKPQPSTALQGSSNSKVTLDDAMLMFHDAVKLLFFSGHQLSLLSASHFVNVIIWGDYGTGRFILHL